MQDKQSPTTQKISCCPAIWREQQEIINPKIHWSSTKSINYVLTPSSAHHSKISLKIPPLTHHQLRCKGQQNLGLVSVNTLNQKEKWPSKELTRDIQHDSSLSKFESTKHQETSQMKGITSMKDTKQIRASVQSLRNASKKEIPVITYSEREFNKSKLFSPNNLSKNKFSLSNFLTAQVGSEKTKAQQLIGENLKESSTPMRKESSSEIMLTSGNLSKSLKLGKQVWTVISEIEEDKEEPGLKIEESQIFLDFFNPEDSQLSILQRR